MLQKQPAAQVVCVNFVGKACGTVGVGGGGSGEDYLGAVFFVGDLGVIEGIYVYSKAQGML